MIIALSDFWPAKVDILDDTKIHAHGSGKFNGIGQFVTVVVDRVTGDVSDNRFDVVR
jgi:hypothetical protein